MLIDVHDYDGWIDGRGAGRTVAKTRVQRIVFQALDKVKYRRSAFADEREVVESQRKKCNENADNKRGAVAPPRQKQFVDAESAPPLLKTC
jgi:hypothetical protein